MATLAELSATSHRLGLALRRRFWKPLRDMMDIFHVLPLTAGVIIFVLLASSGQIRELYISYLEGPYVPYVNDKPTITPQAWGMWILAMAFGLGLIALTSAVLFEMHHGLSNMRRNIVYSSYSNPDSNSMMRALQKGAGFIL